MKTIRKLTFSQSISVQVMNCFAQIKRFLALSPVIFCFFRGRLAIKPASERRLLIVLQLKATPAAVNVFLCILQVAFLFLRASLIKILSSRRLVMRFLPLFFFFFGDKLMFFKTFFLILETTDSLT